jgi:hypothetical protein
VDSEAAFWKAKYVEQLMLSTQVIMMLSNPGGLGVALTQAGLQKPPTGQPEASNGAVSPAQVRKWGDNLRATQRREWQPGDPQRPRPPIAERPPADFNAEMFPEPTTVAPGGISVDGDPE